MSGGSNLRHRHHKTGDQKNDYYSEKDRTYNESLNTSDEKGSISSLHRTRNMLQTELERVSHLSTALDSDGSILASTKEEYQSMQIETKGAKGSLYKLKRLELEDSIIFWSSVVFFYLVCLYVCWSRIVPY